MTAIILREDEVVMTKAELQRVTELRNDRDRWIRIFNRAEKEIKELKGIIRELEMEIDATHYHNMRTDI